MSVGYRLAKQSVDSVGPNVEDFFRSCHKVDRLHTEILRRHQTECKTRVELQHYITKYSNKPRVVEENWPTPSDGPVEKRRKWNWLGHTLKRNDDSIAKEVLLQWRPQGHRERARHLENRLDERKVDSRFQIQLEEDGGGRTGQSWIEIIGL